MGRNISAGRLIIDQPTVNQLDRIVDGHAEAAHVNFRGGVAVARAMRRRDLSRRRPHRCPHPIDIAADGLSGEIEAVRYNCAIL